MKQDEFERQVAEALNAPCPHKYHNPIALNGGTERDASLKVRECPICLPNNIVTALREVDAAAYSQGVRDASGQSRMTGEQNTTPLERGLAKIKGDV